MNKIGREWIAIAISVVAIFFSGLQWLEAYELRQAAFEANVGLDVDTDPSGRSVGVAIRNIGPGIARIRSIDFYLDKRQIADIDGALDSAGFDSSRGNRITLDPGETMAAGESDALIDYRPKNKVDREHAMDFVENHLGVVAEYCAQNGKCAKTCSDPLLCTQLPTVSAAPVNEKKTPALSFDRIPDWLTALGTVGAVLTAVALSLIQLRSARRESASRTFFSEAEKALRTAVDEFVAKPLADGKPRNERRHWLNFARALKTAQALASKIETDELKQIWKQTEHYWRERVYDVLNPMWESFPADYYGYITEADRYKNIGQQPGERAPLAESSLAVVYGWVRWPDSHPDSLDRRLQFPDGEIERMEAFGPRGLARYIRVLRELTAAAPDSGDT